VSVPKRYLVDTNVLLRFLAGEPPLHAAAARKLFERAHAGEVVLDILPFIVAEAFYTLTSFYGMERKRAAERLSLVLQQRGLSVREARTVQAALARVQTSNVAFADAYLVANALEESLPVASFDRDFDKFKDVRRYEPVA
jgi:predicted nucleic acid-binding protein